MENNKNAVRPFGMRDKLGYLFGDFGNDFTFLLSSSFLLKFYTDVMGVGGAVVGVIMMIARIVDAFTDVTMGRICDRSKMTPAGKFKPWIRRMCIPVAVASFLIYQSGLAGMSSGFKTVYLFVTYILWGSIFYTSINIPYGSMASAVSPEPGDRQSLSTYRTMGGMLAGMIVMAGVPLVAYDKIDGNSVLNGGRFTIIAGVCSVLAVVCYMLCYKLITERVKPEVAPDHKQDSVVVMLKKAMKNRALISIIAASITMLLAQLTMQGMANYVYPNYYGDTMAQSLSSVMMMAGMIVAAVVAKPREDGSVYALYSWARKLGQAASAGLTGVLLSLIGYTEKTAFNPAVVEGIFNVSCIVPAIGFVLLALTLWFWYPLHKKQVDANVLALKEKHGK